MSDFLKKNEIRFSVIVAVFNGEKTVNRCINSINAAKKDYNIDLIIINDGSTDNTSEILDFWVQKTTWIKIINQNNSGVAIARNKGLDFVNGNYVCFIDADDTIDDWYFDFIYENIKETNLDMLIFGHKRILLNGCIIERRNKNLELSEPDLKEIGLRVTENRNIYWYTCTRVFNFNSIQDIRFNSKIRLGSDVIFIIEAISKSNRIKVVEECPYNYYENSNSITSSKFKKELLSSIESHFDARLKVNIKPNNKIEENILLNDFAKSYVGHMLPYLLNNIFHMSKKDQIKEIKNIRNSKVYLSLMSIYKVNNKTPIMNIVIFLFKNNFYWLTLYTLKFIWFLKKFRKVD